MLVYAAMPRFWRSGWFPILIEPVQTRKPKIKVSITYTFTFGLSEKLYLPVVSE